ncbi:MAG: hypothetical protein CVU50_09245 [Candidatus Cloacimonetes bacterium HGW-Cloacimonetes-3]|jgi:hypothetical protein|nr:MAG: hypothetical protein CVU50_09245 [Candidatus Cloacimonetes bacterium HGW-Cloacimonetes-3]
MNKVNLALLLLTIISVSLCAVPQTDWQRFHLKGSVERMINDTEVIYFSPEGLIYSRWWGNEHYSSSDYEYIYDAANRLISMEKKDGNGLVVSGDYHTYNASGLLTESKEYSLSDTKTHYFTYNDKQQISWKKTRDFYGKPYQSIEYIYNAAGNIVRENYYDKNDKLSYYLENSYDKNSNLLDSRTMDTSKKQIRRRVYKYNSHNQCIEESIYQEKKLSSKQTKTYDEQGNAVSIVTFDPMYNTTTRVTRNYSYDTYGNWVKLEIVNNGTKSSEENRYFSYYAE